MRKWPAMRFRFSARTRDGDLRNGQLEAADEAAARAQLERRGMTAERLEEDVSEAPVHIQTRVIVPTAPPEEARQRWWESIDWAHLDKRRLAVLVGVVLACLWVGLALVRWILSDRTYHIHLSGQVKIASRKPQPADIYSKLTPRVWLPQLRWVVTNKGEVWAKDPKGVWQKLDRRASFDCQFATEGSYSININLAMPIVPERAMLYFPAGRFRRVSRQMSLRPRNNIFEGEVPTMVLVPRARRRPKAKAGTKK